MDEAFTGVREHYDLMIAEMDDPSHLVTDPFYDRGKTAEWLEHADEPAFFEAAGDVTGKALLEIGVGTGRVTAKFLARGCASLLGIDISPRSLERAALNLAQYTQVELRLADGQSFVRPAAFDLVYAVWTLFHLPDARAALAAAVTSLRPGGRIVLSIEAVDAVLDYGSRRVKQYPLSPAQVAGWLRDLGCELIVVEPVTGPDGAVVTTIVAADKR